MFIWFCYLAIFHLITIRIYLNLFVYGHWSFPHDYVSNWCNFRSVISTNHQPRCHTIPHQSTIEILILWELLCIALCIMHNGWAASYLAEDTFSAEFYSWANCLRIYLVSTFCSKRNRHFLGDIQLMRWDIPWHAIFLSIGSEGNWLRYLYLAGHQTWCLIQDNSRKSSKLKEWCLHVNLFSCVAE